MEMLQLYRRFVDAVENHSDDFDLFCDCYALDSGSFTDKGRINHAPDCMTVAFRKDAEKLQ